MKTITKEKTASWKERYEEFRKSGLTRKAYCEKNGITKSTLDYWFTRIGKSLKADGLVELKMGDPPALKSSVTVIISSKYQIEVQSDFDPYVFCEVVKALETLG